MSIRSPFNCHCRTVRRLQAASLLGLAFPLARCGGEDTSSTIKTSARSTVSVAP